jgi:putative serine protease PepD
MTRSKLAIVLLAFAATVAVVVGFTSRTRSAQTAAVPPAGATALQQAFVDVFRSVSPSVVQIQTSSGLGSGIVFDRQGDIVTNDHVVSGASTITVTTSTGRQLQAQFVGEFVPDDLAVIRVNATNLRAATLADSSKLEVGDIAMAIGTPLGLASSVTEGIVSGLNRQEPEGNGVTLQNAIQTSAPINPGNSGGALVDIQGRVIGIPTLAASDPQLGGTAAGIGFAIPSSVVKDIAGQIVKHGHVVNSHRAYLGITIADTGDGVYVSSVGAGGPAAKVGIAVGDVIIAVAGKAASTSVQLGTVLAGLRPGQAVRVKIVRQDGSTATVTVKLGELPGG